MTNSTLRRMFGKALMIGFVLTALSVASFAQSQYAALYNRSNNGHVGYIGVYGATIQITWSTPGLVTVVSQPCATESGGSTTCLAMTYSNGRIEHKGEFTFFSGGMSFAMRDTQKWNVNQWESEYNDGWTAYYIQ